MVVKSRILRKTNLITTLAKKPYGVKIRTEVSVLGVGVKTSIDNSRKDPRNQAGTENPIHRVPEAPAVDFTKVFLT